MVRGPSIALKRKLLIILASLANKSRLYRVKTMKIWMSFLLFASGLTASATDLQGVVADWNCVQPMVKQGRAKALKANDNCSLDRNYSRSAYGIITDDQHYYKLDDAGRNWALRLLKGTPAKNNLRVIVSGDLEGGIFHVKNMSEL